MVQVVEVYRNGAGDVFFRLSPTSGKMGKLQIDAASAERLEQWLTDNGFALQFRGPRKVEPVAA